MQGSSEEVDEFGLVLKFTWGNTQLRSEPDTDTRIALLSPSHPASMVWESTHTPHPWSHTGLDRVNALPDHRGKEEGLAVPWMASSPPSQEAASWLQAHLCGIPGRSAFWLANLLPEMKICPSKDCPRPHCPRPQGGGRKEGQTSVGHPSLCQTYWNRTAVR